MIPESDELANGLIVLIQPPKGSPMQESGVIAALAETSLRNGAVGICLESPENIGAARIRCPNAFIIGFWNCKFSDSPVLTTPGWHEIKEVWSSGADIIAIDASNRFRPNGQKLEELIERTRDELNAPLLAEIDDYESGLKAANLGIEWISTTFNNYDLTKPDDVKTNIFLIQQLREKLGNVIHLVCGSGINSPKLANKLIKAGANNVIVGPAITGIDENIISFINALSR